MMTRIVSLVFFVFLIQLTIARGDAGRIEVNLLLNPRFDFHSFVNHRDGKAISYMSSNVAFWNTDGWGDINVMRESHASPAVRPSFSTGNIVEIKPGKRLWQFFTLPEAGLAHGDFLSLNLFGNQQEPGAIRAKINLMKLDSETGEWSPKDFGMLDKRTFPKHSRGELIVAKEYVGQSSMTGQVELKIEGAEILGKFTPDRKSHSEDINTVGIRVEIENAGKKPVFIYQPCLCSGKIACRQLPAARDMTPYYRHIPRTIQKLWKKEPLHIIVMGSSIDRGSANPPMYLYDEDPKSKTFKQPLSDHVFESSKVKRPDLEDYYGEWRHYFSYSGRLKRELMRKFNLEASMICLNFMALDGSCVGEAHSGLREYCSLSLPPDSGDNGHKGGKTWRELYPALFERPEGPRPDLIIFGSGANEKTDTPDEIAVFEGMIRWIQMHYPNTEFLFCQFQNCGGYTPNPGDMQAISLRYQIPYMDYGKIGDDLTRWCNRYALVPSDGHPQAAAHYIWFKQLEKAFECWDPTVSGIAQSQLPERIHRNTYGWEGEMLQFDRKSHRIKGNKFIFEDTAINCWGSTEKTSDTPVPYVDGAKLSCRRSMPMRNLRNSLFRHGRCALGERHILELSGKDAMLTYVDAKICPRRHFYPIDHKRWTCDGNAKVQPFKSEWGAPYGNQMMILSPGQRVVIDVVATDVSIAYVDDPQGGTLNLAVDGSRKLERKTNVPFVDLAGMKFFMENRKGALGLGFGWHRIEVSAEKAPIKLLGLFTYDSRPNRHFERREAGVASPGEIVSFSLPFKTRPFIVTTGGLKAKFDDVSPNKVVFSGGDSELGAYEVIGE